MSGECNRMNVIYSQKLENISMLLHCIQMYMYMKAVLHLLKHYLK